MINRNRKALFGFAALIIYAFHGWRAVFADVPGLYEIENFIRKYGDVGVDIFLFLSGMGLVNSWKNSSSYKEFILRRLKRIVIPVIIADIVFAIINRSDPAHVIKAISGFYFFSGAMNRYLWFAYAILLLYLCFPFYYKRFMKAKSQGLFTLCVILIWLVIICLPNGHVNDWAYIFFNRVPIFLIGIYANLFLQKHEKCESVILYGIAIVLLAVGMYLSIRIKEGDLLLFLPHSYALFPYMMISLSSILLLSKLFDYIPHRILDFYGTFTFEFYCIQERIFQVLEDAFKELPVIAGNLIVLVITTVCAYLIYLINNQIRKQIRVK